MVHFPGVSLNETMSWPWSESSLLMPALARTLDPPRSCERGPGLLRVMRVSHNSAWRRLGWVLFSLPRLSRYQRSSNTSRKRSGIDTSKSTSKIAQGGRFTILYKRRPSMRPSRNIETRNVLVAHQSTLEKLQRILALAYLDTLCECLRGHEMSSQWPEAGSPGPEDRPFP
jgi:hypothetical protein